jgi:hypothetical protein
MAGGLSAPEAADARLAAVRAWWRSARPQRTFGQKADLVYTTVLVGGTFGGMAYGTASSALAEVVDPSSIGRWVPLLVLVALLSVASWGAVQGPVVFSVADVAQLLGAPLSRHDLVARPLRRAFAIGGCTGAVAGALLVIGLAGRHRGIATLDAIGVVVGVTLTGVLGIAVGWAVQSSRRWEHAVRVVAWPAIVLAGALALLAGAGRAGRDLALWWGPWGWAVQPGSDASTTASLAGLLALAALTVAAVTLALRHGADAPTERHLRRAEGRAGLIASLASFDVRTSRRNLADVGSKGAARELGDLRRLRAVVARAAATPWGGRRTGELAVAWHSAVALRRAPRLVAQAVVLGAVGTTIALIGARHPGAVAVGALITYVAAARLLEPMRSELDMPGRARMQLGLRLGRALPAHLVLPALIVCCAAALAAAGVAVAGDMPRNGGLAAIVAVTGAGAIACCAAMSARRGGRLPHEILFMAAGGDPSGGGFFIVAWLVAWPAAAVLTGAGPLLLATSAARGTPTWALPVCLGAAYLLVRVLRTEPQERW